MSTFALPDTELEKLTSLKDWAEKPENTYRPERGDAPPGDRREFVRVLEAAGLEDGKLHHYKVVFSITENKGSRFRQSSFSLDEFKNRKYPHPNIVWLMCQFLGYTGKPTSWISYPDVELPGAIVVCQVLTDRGTA